MLSYLSIEFLAAVFFLLVYMCFMMLKPRLKPVGFLAFMHILTAFFALVSFIFLFKNKFQFNIISLLGFLLLIPGITLLILAFSKLKFQAFIKKGSLIKDGIYSQTRNPVYLGLILSSFSCVFFSFSFLILVYSLMLAYFYFLVMKAEESELEKRFSNEYKKYKKEVSLIIPKLKKPFFLSVYE